MLCRDVFYAKTDVPAVLNRMLQPHIVGIDGVAGFDEIVRHHKDSQIPPTVIRRSACWFVRGWATRIQSTISRCRSLPRPSRGALFVWFMLSSGWKHYPDYLGTIQLKLYCLIWVYRYHGLRLRSMVCLSDYKDDQ